MRLLYVHHSCFVLDIRGRRLLFDPPAPAHLPAKAAEVLTIQLRAEGLTVFASHGHGDHFDPDIGSKAPDAAFVLSDDIEDMLPESVPADALLVEPDETYDFNGMRIETLMSNDLGVAFVITVEDSTIYYGGDLAAWVWPEADPRQNDFAEKYFAGVLDLLATRRIDVAFSNVDGRLPNLGGGVEFVRRVEPGVFAPMHTFGNTGVLDEFAQRLGPTKTSLFLYRAPGDRLTSSR